MPNPYTIQGQPYQWPNPYGSQPGQMGPGLPQTNASPSMHGAADIAALYAAQGSPQNFGADSLVGVPQRPNQPLGSNGRNMFWTSPQGEASAQAYQAQIAAANQAHQASPYGSPTGGQNQARPPIQAQPTQHGYAQAPGQGPYGYYEQQTPAGSFAAANTATASNPYIGQQAQGINGAPSVMPYAQQIAAQSQQANPYLGRTTTPAAQVGQNAYAGANPYLDQAIQGTVRNATQGFNDVANPQFDRMAAASGSFGNTGVEAARTRAMQDFGQNLSNTVGNMRMQDYTQQQGLAENALNRQQSTNQFNAGLGAADLSRNLAGAFQGQGIGLQGLGQQLGAAQFDAGNNLNTQQFNSTLGANDLNRNSTLSQNLGMFNAGAGNTANMFNAGSANTMAGQIRGLAQNQNQFDQNLDFNTWQANTNNMRNGQRDQMDFLNSLMGWNQQGIGNATNVQNTPLNYYTQFANLANQAGGSGAQQVTPLQGNPLMGAIGGWQLANMLFGQGR